ncbi:glycosyltransferase family 4 protein [Halanaerobacter jeridensis]|uniref:Glycogen(Starch) synthase n=1 Tax=Halanaerobacter jeridensis TaxID=706427 RepID=A0A938XSB7_9FIRM|nr:glycosyltransferase family 4 protein [Halanaerobacter jeridensis]MBM7556801.1 glycogen(starch) synthase [Halanaerobacter jeridensis]
MKLLVLSWEYPPCHVGGLASHLSDLLPELVKEGVEVHLITQGLSDTEEYEIEKGIHVYRVPPVEIETNDFASWVLQFNFKLVEKAIEVINYHRIDLIHSHDWLVNFAAQTLKHSYKLPLVTTIHATEVGRNQGLHNEQQRYINDIEWKSTYEAWRVICCSQYMKDEVRDHFSLPDDKVQVINNGVKKENFSSDLPQSFRDNYARPEERIVYFIGRLVREKGVHVLINAAQEVLAHNYNVKFIISGEGPAQMWLEDQAAQLGIREKVLFTGYADKKLRNNLYQIADVAAFPSLYEPFGIVALEAMVTQTPVVVSDVGGFSEIIEHNKNGLKVYPGDSASLAHNLLRVLSDHNLAANIITNAYQEVKTEYNWKTIANKTIDVYQEVLQEYDEINWGTQEIQQKLATI